MPWWPTRPEQSLRLPCACSWVDRWVHIINGTLFRPYSRLVRSPGRQLVGLRASPSSWFAASSMASCTEPGVVGDRERRRDTRRRAARLVERDLAGQHQHRDAGVTARPPPAH